MEIKKEISVNLDELSIGMKAAKITDKEGNEKVVLSINGKNYFGNFNFQLPLHIAAELIRILEAQQQEAIEKLQAEQSKDKEDKE